MGTVAIAGGGVIGLTCAYELLRRGREVVLLEAGEIGSGTSTGNIGWITPSLCGPVPAPDLALGGLLMALRPSSPLYIDWLKLPRIAPWLFSFWRHCNTRDYYAGLKATGEFARTTLELFDALESQGLEFEHHDDGMLFVYKDERKMERYRGNFEHLAPFGYDVPDPLDRAALERIEPGLSTDVISGYRVARERQVRPESFCAALANYVRTNGGAIREKTRVVALRRRNGRATEAETTDGPIAAEQFVFAAGAWSGGLAKALGFSLPVEAGKGYSVLFSKDSWAVSNALYLGEARVGISPFDTATRVAGAMELSGVSLDYKRDRVDAMLRHAQGYFRQPFPQSLEEEWVGLRPMAPDGLPVLGAAPGYDNVYVATGHAMLGVTLAPATAHALADLMIDGHVHPVLQAFSPARFS